METRMVQLPATAAIEYVAAPGGTFSRRSFARGDFCPGGLLFGGGGLSGGLLPGRLLSGGLMPVPPNFNAYTNRLCFLCIS